MTSTYPVLDINESLYQRTHDNSLFFFGTQGDYALLSNFSHAPFVINNVKWNTVEHYYQV